MTNNKRYRDLADIQRIASERQPLVPTEYSNYDEYLKAQKYLHEQVFKQPANVCELCGYPMNYKGHQLTEWEKKWSVHEVCKKKLDAMLDRQTGISRERRAAERRAQRQKERLKRRFQ